MAAPEIAKEYGQQVVETEHLLKALLEQPNGLARRILSKAGSDATRLLDRVDAYIRRQPTVSGDSGQVGWVAGGGVELKGRGWWGRRRRKGRRGGGGAGTVCVL